ncbi:MAG: hypothetical protein GXO64_00240 [Candidatus Micrarchaeota archaeon]|nr:hypothetical protein [Candidatus Micrarchaeota archaeon]
MKLFDDEESKEKEELKKRYSVPEDFVTLISNMINRDFREDECKDCYILSSEDKIVAISNHEFMPFTNQNEIEVKLEELEINDDMIGMGETWVKKDIFRGIIDALETYDIEYKIYIDPEETYPMLITTPRGNITIAPVEMKKNEK